MVVLGTENQAHSMNTQVGNKLNEFQKACNNAPSQEKDKIIFKFNYYNGEYEIISEPCELEHKITNKNID